MASSRTASARTLVGRKTSKSSSVDGRSSPWAPTAVFVLFTCLYWATRTHYNTFDAVSYSNQIAHLYPRTYDLHYLFHPHHLLYNATGYALWTFARAHGYGGGPLVVLESFNATVAAFGVAVFYAALRSLMPKSTRLPLLIATCLGLSFGYWTCATDARVNAASTTLLIASFALICGLREKPGTGRAGFAGVLAGLAVLYHESSGLFLLAALVGIGLITGRPNDSGSRFALGRGANSAGPGRSVRFRSVGAFLAGWIAVAGLGYLIVGGIVLGLHSYAAFHAWSAEYAELGWWWDFHVVQNFHLDGFAIRHAAFAEPLSGEGAQAVTPVYAVVLYYCTLAGWLVACSLFAVGALLLMATEYRAITAMSLTWIVTYAAFFTVWSPGYFVFWVPILAPAGHIVGLTLEHMRQNGVPVVRLVGAWLILSTVVTVRDSIGPHLNEMSSPYERVAVEYRQHTRPGDLVLVCGAGPLADLEVAVPYFADRDCLSAHTALTRSRNDASAAVQSLRAQINTALDGGHNVFISDDLWTLDTGPQSELAKRHRGAQMGVLRTLFKPWHGVVAWKSSHGPVWLLKPAK